GSIRPGRARRDNRGDAKRLCPRRSPDRDQAARHSVHPCFAQCDRAGHGDPHYQSRFCYHPRGNLVVPRRRTAANPALAWYANPGGKQFPVFRRMVDGRLSEYRARGIGCGSQRDWRLAARCIESKAKMTEALLNVRKLRVEFSAQRYATVAVDDVSFDVREGEILGVVGESGAGKSSLANAIIGLIDPPGRIAVDEIRLRGRRIDNLGPEAMRR